MITVILASLIFTASGIAVSAYALRKDSVQQGLYGHLVFYLYLLAIGAVILGILYGLSGFEWKALVFITFGWLFIGRILTFMRLFKELTYLHLAGGIILVVWIIANLILQ